MLEQEFIDHYRTFPNVSSFSNQNRASILKRHDATKWQIQFGYREGYNTTVNVSFCYGEAPSIKFAHFDMKLADFLALTHDKIVELQDYIDAQESAYIEASKAVRALPASIKKGVLAIVK